MKPLNAGPRRSVPGERGFTYMALLAAIAVIGIAMSVAGKSWRNMAVREREEELLFRGHEYRNAIERYYLKHSAQVPGARPQHGKIAPIQLTRGAYPKSIEALLMDPQTTKPYLRRQYKDPITNENFEIVTDPALGPGIVGVRSKSTQEPLKKYNFAEEDKDFEGKGQYSDWLFVYKPQGAPVQAGKRPLNQVQTPGGMVTVP
ncbi:MAG: type II secretion system protein [Nitrospiraceae bacterium]|nr:type II secretion system protein [Nitrospiraceae bacterium]